MKLKEVLVLCQKKIHKDIFRIREIDRRKALFLAIKWDKKHENGYAYLVTLNEGSLRILDQSEWLN
ncbi:MAG: hypothetical protein ACM3UU_11280 [Ignavibacteriales bacterium]